MDFIIQRFQSITQSELSYRNLGEIVHSLDVTKIKFSQDENDYEKSEASQYFRKIYTTEPLELAVLFWPPNSESAIHYHHGFYGYVLVLSGEGENIEYHWQNNILSHSLTMKCNVGGVMNEPDGVVHSIKNSSKTKPLITLHIYYPALTNLDNLTVFEPNTHTIGVLNEKALNASFIEPKEHFHKIEKNAFKFISQEQKIESKSHYIYPILPKPSESEIYTMLSEYYNEQAHEYDEFDIAHESRNRYTTAINIKIAECLPQSEITVLDIAGGTGRRSTEILKNHPFKSTATILDMSEEMLERAKAAGHQVTHSTYNDKLLESCHYDLIYFLYAFGHIPSHSSRLESLRKIHTELKPGGIFCFDVFNRGNRNEWGPNAIKIYHTHRLAEAGYEEGDVFYRKSGGHTSAFLHYFSRDEIKSLLKEAGFNSIQIFNIGYVKNPGEWTNDESEGNFFIVAHKD